MIIGARLDIHARGFWERQRSAFFDVWVCHLNVESYKDLSPKQIYRQHENEKKTLYASRVMKIEQGTFYTSCIYYDRRHGRRVFQIP